MADNRNIIVTMTLRDQLTGKAKQIEGSISSVKRQLNDMSGTTGKADKSFSNLTATILKSAPAFAVATAAITGVYNALRLIRDEFTGGLKAVEEYNMSVATLAGFMTTFAKETDVDKAFQQSVAYAKELVPWLERIDAKTVATGEDLTNMAQAFIMNGIQIDKNMKGAEEGVTNVANALILLTAGQNKTKQIFQEIRGLISLESKESNKLLMILKAKNENFEEEFKLHQKNGDIIAYLGEQLKGMGKSVVLLENTWEAVGSTMSTLHRQVLREGFKPIYEDLLNIAKKINLFLLDQFELSEQNLGISKEIKVAWVEIKEIIKGTVTISAPLIEVLGTFAGLLKTSAEGWALLFATAGPVLERISTIFMFVPKAFKLALEELRAGFPFGISQEDKTRFQNSWTSLFDGMKEAYNISGLQKEIEDSFDAYQQKLNNAGKTPLGTDSATATALKEANRETEEHRKLLEKLKKEVGETSDKFLKFTLSIEKYHQELINVSTDNAVTAFFKSFDDYEERFRKFMKADFLHRQMAKTQDFIVTFSETVQGRLENAFSDAWGNILSGTGDFKENMINIFRDMATSIIQELMRIMFFEKAAHSIATFLMPAGPSDLSGTMIAAPQIGPLQASGAFAMGGVMRSVTGFRNKVVDKPTIFPFARGMGLMGESGSEAIMPLTRTASGDLGVKAEGANSPATTINININAVDAASFYQLAKRNPGAIIGPFMSQMQRGNTSLRATMRSTK